MHHYCTDMLHLLCLYSSVMLACYHILLRNVLPLLWSPNQIYFHGELPWSLPIKEMFLLQNSNKTVIANLICCLLNFEILYCFFLISLFHWILYPWGEGVIVCIFSWILLGIQNCIRYLIGSQLLIVIQIKKLTWYVVTCLMMSESLPRTCRTSLFSVFPPWAWRLHMTTNA